MRMSVCARPRFLSSDVPIQVRTLRLHLRLAGSFAPAVAAMCREHPPIQEVPEVFGRRDGLLYPARHAIPERDARRYSTGLAGITKFSFS